MRKSDIVGIGGFIAGLAVMSGGNYVSNNSDSIALKSHPEAKKILEDITVQQNNYAAIRKTIDERNSTIACFSCYRDKYAKEYPELVARLEPATETLRELNGLDKPVLIGVGNKIIDYQNALVAYEEDKRRLVEDGGYAGIVGAGIAALAVLGMTFDFHIRRNFGMNGLPSPALA